MSTPAPNLSLAELDGFDLRPRSHGGECRYLCPLCGQDKPKDEAHRSLAANIQTGVWHCHRCKAGGKLREFWVERPKLQREQHAKIALNRAFSLERPNYPSLPRKEQETTVEHEKKASENPNAFDWRAAWHESVILDESGRGAGVAYLERRGIAIEATAWADVRFCRSWHGGAAVVFAIRDQNEMLVAAQGRHISGNGKRTGGVLKQGVFSAPVCVNGKTFGPFDEQVPAIIVCEAPLDALSVASAGFPSMGLCGVTAPDWLRRVCAFRQVFLAFDADEAGDCAARKMASDLGSFGGKCERLRPPQGKDWNEFLYLAGAGTMTDWLAERVL